MKTLTIAEYCKSTNADANNFKQINPYVILHKGHDGTKVKFAPAKYIFWVPKFEPVDPASHKKILDAFKSGKIKSMKNAQVKITSWDFGRELVEPTLEHLQSLYERPETIIK